MKAYIRKDPYDGLWCVSIVSSKITTRIRVREWTSALSLANYIMKNRDRS